MFELLKWRGGGGSRHQATRPPRAGRVLPPRFSLPASLTAWSHAAPPDPISFTGARFCEARVWNIYRKFNKQIESHMDYAQGFNLSNPMPVRAARAQRAPGRGGGLP